jgi:hypothetical protein
MISECVSKGKILIREGLADTNEGTIRHKKTHPDPLLMVGLFHNYFKTKAKEVFQT